jgi:hypothetical protein
MYRRDEATVPKATPAFSNNRGINMQTILIILLVLFLFGGGGWGYSRWRR